MTKSSFWQNKRVFITGHTGFKGSWLSIWLYSLGSKIKGYALEPPTSPSLFKQANVETLIDSEINDIRSFDNLKESMADFNPDILIHMAAQPLVRYSYDNPIETYEVNVLGTVHVLEAAKNCNNLKAIINVTTDKCYENNEWVWGYRENDPMGGYDPYSSSKGCAELVTSAYRRSYFQQVGLASVRAGNVIGGGDWAKDRLIPDILRAFADNKSVTIRNPKSIRPWQYVLEPISGYLMLAEKLYDNPKEFSEGWNFGPRDEDVKPVEWILDKMVAKWSNASWELDENFHPHEAGFLKLDISKASSKLGWFPMWNLEKALDEVINWHQSYLRGENMQKVCLKQISNYLKDTINESS